MITSNHELLSFFLSLHLQNIEAHVYACGTWCVEERLELEPYGEPLPPVHSSGAFTLIFCSLEPLVALSRALGMDAPSIPPIHRPRPRPPIPPTPPTYGRLMNAPDPVISPDITTSFPNLPAAPDSVDSNDTSESESLFPSTTTGTSTSNTSSISPEPSLPSTTTTLSSLSPTPTTSTVISSDIFTPDSETVHFSTLMVSESSLFIAPTTSFGFSTSTSLSDNLIPSSSGLTYPTDNGNHASNPDNIPASDGSSGGGNPSKATAHRGLSTGAVVGIVTSLALFCFVGFVFCRRRQRQELHTEYANRWWFSRTRRRTENYTYNAAERPPTVYSSSFGSSFMQTRSNSLLSTDEFDGPLRPPMMEVGMLARTTPSLSLGPTSRSPNDSVFDGPHSLTTNDSQYFVRPDSESSYNESIPPPPTSVRIQSNLLSESSTALPQYPPSPKYNSSYSRTSSGRSLALIPGLGSPTTRVFIPPIPPLPKSPPPVPIPNPFLDHNPFDDPVPH